MESSTHNKYMQRCLALARGGAGNVSPNPMVGAVVVHQDRIIGEGFHRQCGEAHAEVNALAAVKDESLLRNATLYVSLEPCSHYGKTPPCAELIIRKGIPRVVVGCLDPFPAVSGRGVRVLREAGVEVATGVMEQACRELNHHFISRYEQTRPYIILKWAQSPDGFMDSVRTDCSLPAAKLSSPETTRRVHQLRAQVAAILVGTRTALLDNPSLTLRYWAGRSPMRVALDRQGVIPSDSHLLDGTVPTLLLTEQQEAIQQVNVEHVIADFSQPILPQLIRELNNRQIDSLLVEGGSALLESFLKEGLWDEIRIETAPKILGNGVPAPLLHPQYNAIKIETVLCALGHTICIYKAKIL